MGLIGKLLTLPVTGPGAGAMWVARQIHEAALSELTDPAAIRRTLRDLEAQLIAGDIDDAAFEEAELILLTRLKSATP
ncbi:MAG: gas vesicle protein GvpG [Pseudomonadota bacterium]